MTCADSRSMAAKPPAAAGRGVFCRSALWGEIMEDKQIVELYLCRSEDAIYQTALKYGKYCYQIAYNILENSEDAKESVNDTYYGAWNSIPPHKPAVLSAFLGKIARRTALNRWKKKYASKRGGGEVVLALDELSECIPAAQRVEYDVERAELSKAVNDFVMALPLAERRVFVCRYWYLDSIEAISRQFGFSQSKVKSMLHRTRHKLLNHLKKEGFLYDD